VTATDRRWRAALIAGAIMIAVGVARIIIGVYVGLGVFLIGLGLLTMLIPLWQRRRGGGV
jgi:hypothetical protein